MGNRAFIGHSTFYNVFNSVFVLLLLFSHILCIWNVFQVRYAAAVIEDAFWWSTVQQPGLDLYSNLASCKYFPLPVLSVLTLNLF